MFRLFAIGAVVAALGAALYFSGDALEAWESPRSSPQASAVVAKRSNAKRRHRGRVSRERRARPAAAQPAWLVQLNALCRHSQADAAAVPLPITAEAAPYYVRQLIRIAKRFNSRAPALVRRAAPEDATRLNRLFAQEEALLDAIASAAERRQARRFQRLEPALASVAKSENGILSRLGATDCTVPQADLGL